MRSQSILYHRSSWQVWIRVIGAVTLALLVLAGSFVVLGSQPATAQSAVNDQPVGSASTDQPQPALQAQAPDASQAAQYKIVGWNDLGMHCMNESFANLAVLPPYNTLWAQVIRQGSEPQIVTNNVTVEYSFVDNTYSAGKTNFWTYAKALFGVDLAPNVGLTGSTLAGQMHISGDHFVIEGVPLTPYRDSAPQPGPQNWYPYQLAHLVARDSVTGQVLAETTTTAPVSTEMRCDTCHADGMRDGIATGNVETNILTFHDREEGTNLMGSRPVLCASCHASNALGLPGKPGIPNLSNAMHSKHAPEAGAAGASLLASAQAALDKTAAPSAVTSEGTNNCYLCHPGQQTQCLRGVMYSQGLTCTNCHGGTADVANPARRPWIDEPKCGTCHGAQYAEETGKRYRDSKGHGGVYCEACHGSPHAILPSTQPNDNIQNISLQGHAGTLDDCKVCHGTVPSGAGPHGLRASDISTAIPTATGQPGQPTATATPTATAMPAATATPTNTPLPTPTATVHPTATPRQREVEFKGQVQARPSGRIGVWRIDGKDVTVDASTRFDESKGPAVVGATVAVKGFQDGLGQIRAVRITVEDPVATPALSAKFIGAIERLPGGDLIGVWQVAGRTVNVNTNTQLQGDQRRYVVGAQVRVRGWAAADGSINASEIDLYGQD